MSDENSFLHATAERFPWVLPFLRSLAKRGTITRACLDAGIGRTAVARMRLVDPVFEAALLDAMEEAADELEETARKRAIEGVQKGVYHLGVLVDTETQYSDTLLALMLKGRRKEVFGTNRTELGGIGGGPIDSTFTVVSGVPGLLDDLV